MAASAAVSAIGGNSTGVRGSISDSVVDGRDNSGMNLRCRTAQRRTDQLPPRTAGRARARQGPHRPRTNTDQSSASDTERDSAATRQATGEATARVGGRHGCTAATDAGELTGSTGQVSGGASAEAARGPPPDAAKATRTETSVARAADRQARRDPC
jgi:hypothetical protein